MFETVGVMAISACILQMVYEKIEKQRPVVDYTEENKKFRSFYFASVASIFIPVDCAVNRGNNERQIEKAKERLYVASVFRLKTKAIRSI